MSVMNLDNLVLLKYYLFGIAAFFNPCGVALLPAYVSHYLAKDESASRNLWASFLRGIEIGSLVSLGFFMVFMSLGFLIFAIGIATANKTIFPTSSWTALLIGVILFLMGGLMLFRRTFSFTAFLERLAGRVQKKDAGQTGIIFYFFYGVGYAIASCGCTLPLFASMLLFVFSESPNNGILIFGAYAWGMTSMMLLLSLLTVFAKAFLQKYLKSLVPIIQTLSGLVMIAAGSYLIYEQLKLISPQLVPF